MSEKRKADVVVDVLMRVHLEAMLPTGYFHGDTDVESLLVPKEVYAEALKQIAEGRNAYVVKATVVDAKERVE